MNPLPQDCIVEILPLTSPCDVCRSSPVSMIFKSAADSDDVWNQFLPSDLPDGFVAPDHEKFLVHHDSHLVQIIHIVMMSPPLHTVGMDVDEINATQDWQRRTAYYS